jgi:hypothetical protein
MHRGATRDCSLVCGPPSCALHQPAQRYLIRPVFLDQIAPRLSSGPLP